MNIRSTFPLLRLASGLVLVCSLVLGTVSPAHAGGMCYVNAAASGSNDGTSWTDAYTDLQSALANLSCNEVWVAKATYKPASDTDRTVSFVLRNNLALYGGFAGNEALLSQRNLAVNPTILSGEIGAAGSADNSYHVVVADGTDSTAVLDGFTVTGGNANGETYPERQGGGMYVSAGSPRVINVTFQDNLAFWWGGGLSSEAGSPTLAKVIFSGNQAYYGGGMGALQGSTAQLTDVTFSGNSAPDGGGMYTSQSSPHLTNVTFIGNRAGEQVGYGGGMDNIFSTPTLLNVTFRNNSAHDGGGISNYGASPVLVNVTLSGNSAVRAGGGMYSMDHSMARLTNVTFSNNSAAHGAGMLNGKQSSPTLHNVTFSGNSTIPHPYGYGQGGAIANYDRSNPKLRNVTISGNSAIYGGGMYNSYESNPVIVNSILYGDTGGEIYNYPLGTPSNPTVTYSIVPGYFGLGILNADPLLGPLQDNGGLTETMALAAASPAIDSGDSSRCLDSDQRGVERPQSAGCDMGAFELEQVGPPPVTETLRLSSIAEHDGWVLESSEDSGFGGSKNVGAQVFRVGDNIYDRQYRAILSFDTSALPDNAAIVGVRLRIRFQGQVGTDPFSTHGGLKVDINRGGFAGDPALHLTDFNVEASREAAAAFGNTPINNWYTARIWGEPFPYIDREGITQFRLRFALDDNDDLSADFLKFFSGDALSAAYRPQLIIRYYVP